MFGLTCDFVQRDGLYMVFDEPGGLPSGRLNRIQLRMISAVNIPHHLRLYLKEIDLMVTLEYAVSGKKRLSNLLKSEKLSMDTLFGLLLQIAQGIEEGKLHMLQPEQYALHEDYIFIDGSLQYGKVFLTYIPLEGVASSVKPGESLKSLIMALMASVTELKGDGVQRLLYYCSEESFSSTGLKELLAELLTGSGGFNKATDEERTPYAIAVPLMEQSMVTPYKSEPNREQQPTVPYKRSMLPVQLEDKESFPLWMNGYSGLRNEQNADESTKEEVDPTVQSSSMKTYVALACLLGDALLWKFIYLNHPQQITLILCAAITASSAILVLLIWKGVIGLGSGKSAQNKGLGDIGLKEEGKADITRTGSKRIAAETGMSMSTGAAKIDYSTADTVRNYLSLVSNSADPVDKRISTPAVSAADFRSGIPEPLEEKSRGSDRTPVPVAPTALLVREEPSLAKGQVGIHQQEPTPYLERSGEGAAGNSEKIELNRSSFIIGRSEEVAQYIEQSEGVSRVHAEISKGKEGYILKDLDSRNGTLLKGEPMVPYKEYLLEDGDVFTIVKGNYIFRSA
ncbi:DUF6382 domain-containing protein [Paenibacillus sp. sgz500958]|uniref:DUF6382 domain-containing protein n=1 Tax=Paenibacillus sp. sgz500958 TaxID=3242475 RepID=UPI0036D3F673